MFIVLFIVVDVQGPLMVNETLYAPDNKYAWVGFCCIDVWPSPQFQNYVYKLFWLTQLLVITGDWNDAVVQLMVGLGSMYWGWT